MCTVPSPSVADAATVGVDVVPGENVEVFVQNLAVQITQTWFDILETRALAKQRFHEIVEGTARVHRATAKIDFEDGYPVTVNHAHETMLALAAAREIAGHDRVLPDLPPVMGAEDFSYMLEARPGAIIFCGNGPSAGLHHEEYDFDDAAIPHGMSYWARLAETVLAA